MTAALTRAEVLVLAAVKAGARCRRPRDRIRLLQEMLSVLEEWEDEPIRFRDRADHEVFVDAAELFRSRHSTLLP